MSTSTGTGRSTGTSTSTSTGKYRYACKYKHELASATCNQHKSPSSPHLPRQPQLKEMMQPCPLYLDAVSLVRPPHLPRQPLACRAGRSGPLGLLNQVGLQLEGAQSEVIRAI